MEEYNRNGTELEVQLSISQHMETLVPALQTKPYWSWSPLSWPDVGVLVCMWCVLPVTVTVEALMMVLPVLLPRESV